MRTERTRSELALWEKIWAGILSLNVKRYRFVDVGVT